VLGFNETNKIRQALVVPPLYPVMEYLGQFNTEAIGAYYLLCNKIDQFRTETGGTSSSALKDELESIRAVQRHCRDEIADDMMRAGKVLSDTQEG
jgi:hypothetical protein